MSVNIENSVPIEKIRFINADNVHGLLDGSERKKTDSEIKSKYFDKFIRRINGFYTWKIPWIVILISILQIVVFFVACNDWIAILTFNPRKKHELWRFITYYTVHFSLTHLLLNVILQIFIAVPLHIEQGHFRIVIVYFSGVGFGAIGSMLFDSSNQTVIGSSAGVYSLLFSHLSQCILNWTTISYRTIRFLSVLMLFGSDILYSMLRHFYWRGTDPKVSFSAHIFGGIAGTITSLIIFKRFKNDSHLGV